MSLMTYQDVRPWARSIKQRVTERQMPPWGIDPHVGLQSFKNDPSLREDEIEKIAKWVDGGAPMGNLADMPKPREWDDSDRWHIGKPDVIVTSPPHKVPAEAADWWGSYYVDTGLTEDRHRGESGPGKTAVVHHLLTYAVDADASGDSNGGTAAATPANSQRVRRRQERRPPRGHVGRPRRPRRSSSTSITLGQKSPIGQLGIVPYRGLRAEAHRYSKQLGQPTEPFDIPGGSPTSAATATALTAGRITAFQPTCTRAASGRHE
jgi:hypothetical protein